MTIATENKPKRLNPQRRKAMAIKASLVAVEIYPYQIAAGDLIDGQKDPVRNVLVNPRGCVGHTHIDSKCYDNIAKVVVRRADNGD